MLLQEINSPEISSFIDRMVLFDYQNRHEAYLRNLFSSVTCHMRKKGRYSSIVVRGIKWKVC